MSHLDSEQGCSLDASPGESDSATGKPAKSSSGRRPAAQSSGKAGIVAKTSAHLLTLVRSRQVRVLLTCCSVLLVGGLVMLNWHTKPRTALTHVELADLELTEPHDEPGAADVLDESDPTSRPLTDSSGNNGIQTADARIRSNNPRLPAVGSADSANPPNWAHPSAAPNRIRDSQVIPAGRAQPQNSAGPRGAWLTGQIESK